LFIFVAYYPKTMEQHIPQDEIRRIIISDMVKKKNSIVPVIGEDTIVYSLSEPLVLLWLFYRVFKWICSTYEEGSKAMRRYTLFTNIGSSADEARLLAPCARLCRFVQQRTYVLEAMNIGRKKLLNNR
jgi:hypothetical protein